MENKLNSYIADMRETSANLAKTTYALSKKISEEKIEESKNIFKKSIEISAKRFNQEIEDDSNTESISKHKKYELLKKYEEEAYRVSNIYNEEIKKLLIEKEHLEAQKRVALIERKKLKEDKFNYVHNSLKKVGKSFDKEDELQSVKSLIEEEIDKGNYEKIPALAARAKELESEKEELFQEKNTNIATYNNNIKDKKTEYKQIKKQIKDIDDSICNLEIERDNEIAKVGMSKENQIAFQDKSIIRKVQRALAKILMTSKNGEKKFDKEIVQSTINNLDSNKENLTAIENKISEIEKSTIKNLDESFIKDNYNKEYSFDVLLKEAIKSVEGNTINISEQEKNMEIREKQKQKEQLEYIR